MKHTQIKVLLDAIKQHIIQIYEENKNYISPEKTDIEKFNILQKKYTIYGIYIHHMYLIYLVVIFIKLLKMKEIVQIDYTIGIIHQ